MNTIPTPLPRRSRSSPLVRASRLALALALGACSSSSEEPRAIRRRHHDQGLRTFTTKAVKAGATVTVQNDDSVTHTVTSDDGTSFNVTIDPGKDRDLHRAEHGRHRTSSTATSTRR